MFPYFVIDFRSPFTGILIRLIVIWEIHRAIYNIWISGGGDRVSNIYLRTGIILLTLKFTLHQSRFFNLFLLFQSRFYQWTVWHPTRVFSTLFSMIAAKCNELKNQNFMLLISIKVCHYLFANWTRALLVRPFARTTSGMLNNTFHPKITGVN